MPTLRPPPGPQGRPVIGHLPEINHDPIGFFSDCARQYGNIFRWNFGPFPAYAVNHPSLIETILVTQVHQFAKSSVYRRGLRILGNGLLNSEGTFWQRQRRLVQPAFHRERIASYSTLMIDYTQRLLEQWQDGEVRDIHSEMMNLALAIVAKALLDVDVAEEKESIHAVLDVVIHVNDQLMNQYLIPNWLPTPSNLRYQDAIRQLDSIIYHMIAERRSTHEDRGDLLSLLLQIRDEDGSQMSDQQVRDEAATLLLAGHETTANALTWLWFLLNQHPQVEARLHEELQTVLEGRAPTLQDISRLQYTERVVLEALRLYPPVWGMSRVAIAACELEGYLIPPGSTVFMSQWLMHHDARYFNQPMEFNPDRWKDNFQKRLPPCTYFPFGAGPRICIGKAFAMMEAVLIVATIASQFRLCLSSNEPVVLEPSLTLRPKNGMRMILKRRHEA